MLFYLIFWNKKKNFKEKVIFNKILKEKRKKRIEKRRKKESVCERVREDERGKGERKFNNEVVQKRFKEGKATL